MSNSYTSPDQVCVLNRRLISIPPLFFLSVAFSIGIWLAHLVLFPFLLVALITIFLVFISTLFVRRNLFIPLSILTFFAIGILFGANDRALYRHHIALTAPPGPLVLEGFVISVPETSIKGKKETISFILASKSFFQKGRSNQVEGKVQTFLHNPGRTIHFGDRLRLRGTLEVPRENRNPHSFDYGNYLAQHGVIRIFRGIGRFSVLNQSEGQGNWFLLLANRLRIYLKGRLEKLFPSPHYEVASALLFGFRKNIAQDIQDAFIKTGTAHLIAISGLNISLVGGLFYFLLSLFCIPRSINLVLSIVFISIYTVLAGANIPVLRAWIMGVVILLGFLLGQERNLKSALFFSFFVLLAWEPSALFQASFQLSFVAMASLIFILPQLERILTSIHATDETSLFVVSFKEKSPLRFLQYLARLRRSITQTFLASLAATIGMFPLLIWYFNLFSVIGFLANVIAIPVCTMGIAATLILLLLDFIFPPLAQWLSFLPLAFFKLELWCIEWFAKVPVGYLYLQHPPWFFLALYYGFLIAWLVFSNRSFLSWFRMALVISMSLVAGGFFIGASPISSRIIFFDLGKTESAFISFSNGANCLINTGRSFPSDQAYWILRPFLMASGIQKLDSVLFTKVDGRHAGGFHTLIHHVQLRNVLASVESRKTASWDKYIGLSGFKRLKVHSLSPGSRIQFGSDADIYIEVLSVSPKNAALKPGEISGLHIQDGKTKILYLASVNAETFQALSQLSDLQYDFIFLPHHEFKISEDEKSFLTRLSCHFIVLNQRDQIDQFKAQLEFPLGPKVLFMEESGAVEFYRSRSQWIYRAFLNSAPKSSSRNKFHLAY